MRAVGGTDFCTQTCQNFDHPLGWKIDYEEDLHMKLRLIARVWIARREAVARGQYKSCFINPKLATRKNKLMQWKHPNVCLYPENISNEKPPDEDELTFQLPNYDSNGLARMKPFNQSVSISEPITPKAKINDQSIFRDTNWVTIDFDFQAGFKAAKPAKKSKKVNKANNKGSGRSEGNKKNGRKDEEDEEPEEDQMNDDHKDDDRRDDEDKHGDRKKEEREKEEREREEREKEEREKEEREKEEREKEEREKEEREKEEREKEEREKEEREKEEREKEEREKEEREKEEREKEEREEEKREEEQEKNFETFIEPSTKKKSTPISVKVPNGKEGKGKAKASMMDLETSIENVNSVDNLKSNSNQAFDDQDRQQDPLQDSLGVKSWGSDWITGTYQNPHTDNQKKTEFNESEWAQRFNQSSNTNGEDKEEDLSTFKAWGKTKSRNIPTNRLNKAKPQKKKTDRTSDNENTVDLDASKNEVVDLCDGSEDHIKSTEAPKLELFTTQLELGSLNVDLTKGDETSACIYNKAHAPASIKLKNKVKNCINDLVVLPEPIDIDFASKEEPTSPNKDRATEANEESIKQDEISHIDQAGPESKEDDAAESSVDKSNVNNTSEDIELLTLKEVKKTKHIKSKNNGYETISQADGKLQGVDERQAAEKFARGFGADKSWKMTKSQKKAQEAAARKAERELENARKEEQYKLAEEARFEEERLSQQANQEKESRIIFKNGENKKMTKNQKKAQEAASSRAEREEERLAEEEGLGEQKYTEEAKTKEQNSAEEVNAGEENSTEENKTEGENYTEEAQTGAANTAEENKIEGENYTEEAQTGAANTAEENKTEGENSTEENKIEGENYAEEAQTGEKNTIEEAQIEKENSLEATRKEDERLAQEANREKNTETIFKKGKNKKVKMSQKRAQEAEFRVAKLEERLAGGENIVEEDSVEENNIEKNENIIPNNSNNTKITKGQEKAQDSAAPEAAKENEKEEKNDGEEEKVEPVEETKKEEDGQAEDDNVAEAQATADEVTKEEQDNYAEKEVEEVNQADEDNLDEDQQEELTRVDSRVEESLPAGNYSEEVEAMTQLEKTSAAKEESENLEETGTQELESQIKELDYKEDEAADSKVNLIEKTPSEDEDQVKSSKEPAEKTPRSLMPPQPSKNTQSTKMNRHAIKAPSRKDEKKPKVKSNDKEKPKETTIRNSSSIKDRQKDKAKIIKNPTTTKTSKVERPPLSRGLSNIFAPPVRSKSTSEKNSRKIPAKNPRRASTSEGISGIDNRPASSSKAPKPFYVAIHSPRKSEDKSKASGDKIPAGVTKTKNLRNTKAKDNDVAATDNGGPSYHSTRRPETAKKSSFGGIFSGLISSKSRPESKNRNLVSEDGTRGLRREGRKIKHHDRENSDIKTSSSADQENEERQAARRIRRAERQAAEKIAEEARRAEQAARKSKEERQERYRKEKEEYEIRKLEEEKQSAARRAHRAHLDAERQNALARENKRLERRRSEKAQDAERALFEAKERERQERRRAGRAQDAERALIEAKERERQERRRAGRAQDAERALFEAKERERQERRRAERAQIAERMISEAKEYERLERRRARQEKEAAHVISYDRRGESRTQSGNSSRRKSQVEGIDEDEVRRLRREERRARRKSTGNPRSSRQKSVDRFPEIRNKDEQAEQMYEYIYEPSIRQTDDSLLNFRTNYWVREHSDVPPPPPSVAQMGSGGSGERKERRRRLRSRHSTNEKVEDQAPRERRRQSSHAIRENTISLESSKGNERRSRRRDSRRDSAGIDSRAPSTHGGLFSRWKRIAGV